ncbi:UDP-N-acetylmuramoyl-L-alanine--D-glutamate ligase [Castellaniella sp.]|uniref:UDP-N-acetylmuramoyl-L-alanine--D-glutamate ligase n=1 Tax=Castellaniella sp. TaxID=1955812 RepID=UPI00355EF7B8
MSTPAAFWASTRNQGAEGPAPVTLIMGLGETGVAAARWCAGQGDTVRVLDTRPQPPGLAALQAHGIAAQTYLGVGHFDARLLDGVRTLVLSPGICPRDANVADFLAQARALGVDVLGEIELFARALKDLAQQGYAPRVLAVTGTNGKTTVTALVRALGEAAGYRIRAAGNIGPAALAALLDALEQDRLPEIWVLELSSFQIEGTRSLRADAAVVLNVTQDHLDWHGSMSAYAAAKARLYEMADCLVFNRDDAWVRDMIADPTALCIRSFGAGLPPRVGDLGIHEQGGMAWLAVMDADRTVRPVPGRKGSRQTGLGDVRATGPLLDLMPVEALRIPGGHNVLNAQAALALGRAIGLDWAPMLHALRAYRGEAHRMQFVRSVAGVDFINDSKGTNVGATVAALEGLGRPVVLIAGGLGKGQDFSPLCDVVRDHARMVVLMGQDAGVIAQALSGSGVPTDQCASLEEAVRLGFEQARPGDAVLLSPACASMDMFRNYVHRGEHFVACVEALAADRGEVA